MGQNKKKILIIDDSELTRSFLAEMLIFSYEVDIIHAENGQQGLDLLASENPDLVIADINMPVMNGIDFIHQARGELNVSIPIIVASTSNKSDDRIKVMEAGATNIIFKPFDSEALAGSLAQFLGQPKF